MQSDAQSGAPLEGIRVVSLEHAVAAPLCSRHLADLGAEVIKVERPGGDFARHYDSAVSGESANFVWLNRGKASVVLDLASADGREGMRILLRGADVFTHNLGPGSIDRLGFDYESVRAMKPNIIWCGISGYGLDGPYANRKGFDLLVQGEAGIFAVTGTPEFIARAGIPIADIAAGSYALATVLALLYRRSITGEGGRADISMFDSLAEWMSYPALLTASGRPPHRTGARHAGIVPYGAYPCGDGKLINIAVQNDGQWKRLAEALGRPDWLTDPRYQTIESRAAHRAELEPDLEQSLAKWSLEDAMRVLEAADIPVGRVNDLESFVRHPQLTERGRWLGADSDGRSVEVLDHPLNIAGLKRRRSRIPRLGEDTVRFLEGRESGSRPSKSVESGP